MKADFFNVIAEVGDIKGNVWRDFNGDGRQATDPATGALTDTPLAGWTIYLDTNNNRTFDLDLNGDGVANDSEPNRITDANGDYAFHSVPSGSQYVGEVLPTGWEASRGFDSYVHVTVTTGGEKVTNIAVNMTVKASHPTVRITNYTGKFANVGAGQIATFDVEFTGDGRPHRFDLQFIREGTDVVLGMPIPGNGYEFEDLVEGEIELASDFGSRSLAAVVPNVSPNFVAGANGSVLEDAGAQTVTTWATSINGDSGLDDLHSGDGDDSLSGGANNDTLDGDAGVDRLQRSLDEMRQFTSDAAHELRSPLAVMRTESEVALRNARSVEEYRHVIEVHLEETKRLSAVVDQLLTLSRHDAGVETGFHDDVPLDALLGDVAEKFRTVAREKGLTFDIAPIPAWSVKGDDIRLSQLFFNLLDNAMKYTPTGGHVALKAETNGRLARLIIEDTGVGIPAEHLPHLFNRFYRVDHSRNRAFGGTGLGLAICQSIVEAHHGQIEVNSQPNLGTRFTVTLPGRP